MPLSHFPKLYLTTGGLPRVCQCRRNQTRNKWGSANEYYMIMPTGQSLDISGGGSESVKPWGFGFRAVGHKTISKTGGLQFQSIKVDNPHTGKDTFYLFDLLLGMEYMTPKV